ncbi:MAG: alpha/beta hydrolase [Alphaproteobacteria bacterium]|nr:MAG: alpha/beta hydrolase [Alphaproteobacteria bacterium]
MSSFLRDTIMTTSDSIGAWEDIFYTSHDGLTLYARHYPGKGKSGLRPALCLPGLTRNSKDFHVLASHLAAQGREVYALDFRGRGRSARDPDWRNYTPFMELLDTQNFMTIAGLHEAALIGTSRGGIVTMLLAVMRPTAIGVCILNDIGPELETAGLARIIGYVGKTPVPADWKEAAEIAKRMNQQFFTDTDDAEWEAVARQWFADVDGRPGPDYDPQLAKTMEEIDLTSRIPDMWPQFKALAHAPTMVIRGENSDLLSEETFARMQASHPDVTPLTVRDEGHAPFLRDTPTLDRIAEFLARADRR